MFFKIEQRDMLYEKSLAIDFFSYLNILLLYNILVIFIWLILISISFLRGEFSKIQQN